jgi:hypothetical protein
MASTTLVGVAGPLNPRRSSFFTGLAGTNDRCEAAHPSYQGSAIVSSAVAIT